MNTFVITPSDAEKTKESDSSGLVDDATRMSISRVRQVLRWQTLLRLAVFLCYVGVAVGIWQLIMVLVHPPIYILPGVAGVFTYYRDHWALVLSASRTTLVEIIAGFGLGLLVGLLFAICFDLTPAFRRIVWPYLLFLQVLPKIAIAPWMLLIFGFGIQSKIVLAALLAFFPVLVSSLAGFASVSEAMDELARSMQMSRIAFYRYVKLPGALPQIFSGAKVGITLAVIGAVVGEFIGGNNGLGYLIVAGEGNADSAPIMVGIINLSILGSLLYGVVTVIERFSISWHISHRRQQSSPLRHAPIKSLASTETVGGQHHDIR